jgi:predicted transcriptional regulator
MSVVTLRIPDEKHARLKQLANSRSTSVNRLMDELATIALVQHDLSVQFAALAKEGDPAVGLALLDELDAHFTKKSA